MKSTDDKKLNLKLVSLEKFQDEDLSLAKALQEQERCFMMLQGAARGPSLFGFRYVCGLCTLLGELNCLNHSVK